MFAPKKILVPTDFTNDSDRALREAVDIAKAFGAKVFLIHVDQRVMDAGADFALAAGEIEGIEKRDVQVAMENLRTEIQKISKETEVGIEIAERHGETHEELLSYGKEKGIDLIVIERHAKKGFLKSLMGGVADKVTHQAFCSVLVLH